jgi:predicted nucleic acid-binding protein
MNEHHDHEHDHWPLGVVAQAKRTGLIDAAKPVLDELIGTARFWVGPDLYAEVLAQLGEP